MSKLPATTVQWSERILERARVACQHRIGAQVLQSMRVETFDHVVDGLLVRLTTDLLRESVGSDEKPVDFRTRLRVAVPGQRARRMALAAFGIAGACGLLGPLLANLALAIAGVVVALLAVGVLIEPVHPAFADVDVSGTVTVRADHFDTYPQNSNAIPESFGSSVRVLEYTPTAFDLEATCAK